MAAMASTPPQSTPRSTALSAAPSNVNSGPDAALLTLLVVAADAVGAELEPPAAAVAVAVAVVVAGFDV